MTLNKNLKNHLQSSNFNLFPTLVIQYANVISELERENIFNTLKKRSTNSHTSIIEGSSSSMTVRSSSPFPSTVVIFSGKKELDLKTFLI